jgi:endothelin-converting enzyme
VDVIDKLVPQVSFTKLIQGLAPSGYKIGMVINSDPQFFSKISGIISSTPRDVIHAYFQTRLVMNLSGRLGKEYTKPLRIYSNQMAGRDPFAESERWRSCSSEIDSSLGWILSAAYIEKAFSPDAKKLGDRIVSDIKEVFSERLMKFDWMSEKTKALAVKKGKCILLFSLTNACTYGNTVTNIVQKIGYPTASPNIMDPKVCFNNTRPKSQLFPTNPF